MPERRKTLPSVLLIILSTLGIFVSLIVIALSLVSNFLLPTIDQTQASSDVFLMSAVIILALVICVINITTLITSINKLQNKVIRKLSAPGKAWMIAMSVLWLITLGGGYLVSQRENLSILLALMTVAAILLPIWILVNLARSGLPRSTPLRERGTLTISLTVSPPIILAAELMLIFVVIIFVIMALGIQDMLPGQVDLSFEILKGTGGINELENSLFALMQDTRIATGVYITLGVFVPLIEETFKPMAIWFLLNRSLKAHEGYAIGLISGGAFALLESAGLLIQIDPADWLPAVALRAATSVLHIGLSGIVGYGFAHSWTLNKRWRSTLFLLNAAALHGAWNSIAIYSGFSALPLTENTQNAGSLWGGLIAVISMILVFIILVTINVLINRSLRRKSPLSDLATS